jgi:hypothetical protein
MVATRRRWRFCLAPDLAFQGQFCAGIICDAGNRTCAGSSCTGQTKVAHYQHVPKRKGSRA